MPIRGYQPVVHCFRNNQTDCLITGQMGTALPALVLTLKRYPNFPEGFSESQVAGSLPSVSDPVAQGGPEKVHF